MVYDRSSVNSRLIWTYDNDAYDHYVGHVVFMGSFQLPMHLPASSVNPELNPSHLASPVTSGDSKMRKIKTRFSRSSRFVYGREALLKISRRYVAEGGLSW